MGTSPGGLTINARVHEELIDSRIELHDSNQFEVKLDYAIDPKARQTQYHVETYFFVPKSLGINSLTYSRDQFYNDTQAYIRFKTPTLGLNSILDPDNRASPLTAIDRTLPLAERDPKDGLLLARMSHELRMLGCLLRANVRDRTLQLRDRLRDTRADDEHARAAETRLSAETDFLLEQTGQVLGHLRGWGTRLRDPAFPRATAEAFEFVDEYCSATVEDHLTVLIHRIDTDPGTGEHLRGIRSKLVAFVHAEQLHRIGCGYATVLNGSGSNEHYVYRRGLLKKWMMSVLFLDITKAKEGGGAGDLSAAVAAGVAMAFATMAAVYSQRRYGMNTLPFVLAVVFSYILKDRIKEWLKGFFNRKMTRWLWDYNVIVRDPHNHKDVGRCREAFCFLARDRVPAAVRAVRDRGHTSVIETESKPEVVLKYEKEIRLNGRTISLMHRRLNDINDIIRFNVASFLTRTDDPERTIRVYREDSDQVASVRCPKVYHINVVFVLRAGETKQPAHIDRVRVVIDKRGIVRLEEA